MKRFLLILAIASTAICANAISITSSFRPVPGIMVGADPDDEDVIGTRRPGNPFQCTFDTERGIEFIGQETPEFALFEIYVTDSECIYASGDEFDFIDHLFTLSGSYQICLTTTEGTVYAGYIDL